jgi:hypothetical protein
MLASALNLDTDLVARGLGALVALVETFLNIPDVKHFRIERGQCLSALLRKEVILQCRILRSTYRVARCHHGAPKYQVPSLDAGVL